MDKHAPLSLFLLILCCLNQIGLAQPRLRNQTRLADGYFKNGAITLRAFAPVSRITRDSVVKVNLDGTAVALGTVIDAKGWIITKASEIQQKEGRLSCTLANGAQVAARLVRVDDDNDLGLVKANATGLKPIRWALDDISAGQWAITPGTELTPEAIGIVSVPPRRILHRQAFIGVRLDFTAPVARIAEITPGLGAERVGLQPDDIILAVNGERVRKSEELTRVLRDYREGQNVKLQVERKGNQFETSVEMTTPKSVGRRRPDRQERMNRLGTALSKRSEGFELAFQHDSVLQPWQCGGPLVNLDGKAIGLNIARAGRIASYALPAVLVKEIVEDLKSRIFSTGKGPPPSALLQ
jgi:serine protease Do